MFWQIQNIISWTEDNWIRKQLSRLGVKIREKISTQVILTEADLANSFLERVDEQPEEKPSETEATDQTSEDDVAEAEEDSEGNVLSQSEQSEETETA